MNEKASSCPPFVTFSTISVLSSAKERAFLTSLFSKGFSISFCKNLIKKTQVGLAPGVAFGTTGDNFLRLCFAADVKFLKNILNRLEEEFN